MKWEGELGSCLNPSATSSMMHTHWGPTPIGRTRSSGPSEGQKVGLDLTSGGIVENLGWRKKSKGLQRTRKLLALCSWDYLDTVYKENIIRVLADGLSEDQVNQLWSLTLQM